MARTPTIVSEWNRPRYVSVTEFQDVSGTQIQDVDAVDILIVGSSGVGDLVLKISTPWI